MAEMAKMPKIGIFGTFLEIHVICTCKSVKNGQKWSKMAIFGKTMRKSALKNGDFRDFRENAENIHENAPEMTKMAKNGKNHSFLTIFRSKKCHFWPFCQKHEGLQA